MPGVKGGDAGGLLLGLGGLAREQLIRQLVTQYPPPMFADWVPVQSSAGGHSAVFFVSPDYLGIGTDDDWLRTPMFPSTAQQCADRLDALLPTRKLVDLIYAQAPVKIGFVAKQPRPGVGRDSSRLYIEHNADCESRRAGRTGLAAGHKKDMCIGNLLARSPGKVIIYGAWDSAGTRIQPYSNVHSASYVDYSHGARLIRGTCTVDGQERRTIDVLRDRTLAVLGSDEGPVQAIRYGFGAARTAPLRY